MEKERKKMGKRKREGGACAPAASAAAVGHARCWSRVRGPGEVRHAERGGHLRQESERPGRACSAEEEREKGGREKKRGREIRGGDRDGRSRVGDKRPCDVGWDGGEEKERRVRSAEKGQMDTSKGIGCWKTGVWDGKEFPGIRVLGFRMISSSTLENF